MEVVHLLKPNQVPLIQAVHLFITSQDTATIEGTALWEDDQTTQARPTQALWVPGALRTCPSTKHSSPASPHKRWDYGWPSRACTFKDTLHIVKQESHRYAYGN